MRLAFLAALFAAAPAFAQDAAAAASFAPVGGLMVTVSYGINAPITGTTVEAMAEEDRTFRRAMYARAVSECEDLLATIAASCSLSGISVSSQINSYPGQPPTIYVSTTVTMQIAPK
jgi:hypothetical protein